MRNVIFTQRVDIIESYGERRDAADQRIPEFILACGYIPVPVPNVLDENVTAFADALAPAGIVLTGGNSLVKYGGNAPERDFTEKTLMDIAVGKNIPVYGFCRGMQFVLDYFGQGLVSVTGHVAVRHKLTGFGGREVNSYHNQACRKITGEEMISLARTEDGVIEAVRHKKFPVFCTMWHPERERDFVKEDMNLVKNLFDKKELNMQ